jgi:four helix bundle protein
MDEYYFERMAVWKNARNLVNQIYTLTKSFPHEETFHLKSQMRRSASSVKSNIAEGQGRMTKKDQAHYTTMSYSSLIELLNHLITALDQEYISKVDLCEVRKNIDVIARQLNALKKTQLESVKKR